MKYFFSAIYLLTPDVQIVVWKITLLRVTKLTASVQVHIATKLFELKGVGKICTKSQVLSLLLFPFCICFFISLIGGKLQVGRGRFGRRKLVVVVGMLLSPGITTDKGAWSRFFKLSVILCYQKKVHYFLLITHGEFYSWWNIIINKKTMASYAVTIIKLTQYYIYRQLIAILVYVG